ncbi:MAG: LPS-assembly protein [Enterobacterales bacterium]
MSLTTMAEEKDIVPVKAPWDMNFFIPRCPGSETAEPLEEEIEAVIDFDADDINVPSKDIVKFKGNVTLDYGLKKLRADEAILNKEDSTFRAKGNIRYEDQQIRLISGAIELNVENQTGEINDTRFQFVRGALRGEAGTISIQSSKQLRISDVGITSCPPGEESWLLESSTIEVDSVKGEAEAKDVTLKINDFAIFYFPYISFPIDDRRKSGFLYPSIGTSSRNGLEFEIPWYLNIAEDKDATFTARYLSKRGLMIGGEYRQLTENSSNEIYAEYLSNDDRGLPGNEDRFFYQVNSEYSEGENWRGNVDLSSVSDDDYFYDFGGNYSSGNRNSLRRFAQVSYDDEHLSFKGIVSNDQLLSTPTDPYSRLPQLRLSVLYPELLAGITTNLHMEATAFRHDNLVEAQRVYFAPELSMPLNWIAGYIKPQIKLHHSYYSQDDPNNLLSQSVSRTVPIYSIDSAMFFDRELDIGEHNFVQTFEPRLFYLYVPSKEQSDIALFDTTNVNNGVDSLFRENRYSGFDRIGDSNQLSVALTNRFYEQSTGRERMRITFGRAYYLEDREVNVAIVEDGQPAVDLGVDNSANSALITNVQMGLYDNWSIKGELEYDDSASRTEKGVVGLHYISSGLAINLQHRLKRYNGYDDVEQAEFSFSWQVSDDLSFVGRWQQDLTKNRTIDSFAGLEYESCCWAIRLVARRYLNIRLDRQGIAVPGTDEFNNGIYLEFILKGLTNIGNSLKLERDIQGYEDRFNNY